MPMPTNISDWADELYQAVAPVADQDKDASVDWAFLKYIIGISAMGYDQITEYARDTDDGKPGWSILLDVHRCPPEALPYLGQFVGVDVSKLAKIKVLGLNIDGDPMGQTATIVYAGLGTGAPHALPDGAIPLDTAAQTVIDKGFRMVSNGAGASACAQILLVTPGLTYNLSVDVYSPAGTATTMYTFDSATFSQVIGTVPPATTPVVGGWFNLNTTFVAPASGVIYLLPLSNGPAAEVRYYSNFQLREVRLETDDEFYARMRTLIANTGGFSRGSPGAFMAAAQQFLTGSKTVLIKERDASVSAVAGGAYGLSVLTYATETPDQAKVLAALLEQKPAGIILDYEVINGTVYIVIRTLYATYTALRAAYATYNGLRNNAPGT